MEDIHSLSEEDIKLRYITPAIIQNGWSVNDITMETKVKLTDGKINLRGNLVARGKAKYADYVLYYNRATPIAIVEAKDANHSVSHGMQQAKEYAAMMDVSGVIVKTRLYLLDVCSNVQANRSLKHSAT
jgi:type I restriction enzyme R subunit